MGEEIEAEEGAPLLTPLQNDEDVDGHPAWSVRLTNTAHTAYAAVCVSSNRWPGAHAFAVNTTFANVYIGWGTKYSSEPFSPALPPMVQQEMAWRTSLRAMTPLDKKKRTLRPWKRKMTSGIWARKMTMRSRALLPWHTPFCSIYFLVNNP